MRRLLPLLIILSTAWATPQDPVYWNYPGPHGEALRAALAVERTDEDAHHLILPDELDAYLSGVTFPTKLGCLDDSGTCMSNPQAILRALGFGARVDATAKKTGNQFEVQLLMTLVDGAKPKTFKGQGKTIDEAVRKAFVALHGQGMLLLDLKPADAAFRIDGRPYGEGSGEYIVGAGKHTLLVEAPKHRSLEQPVIIKKSERIKVIVELPAAYGRVSMKTEPKNAHVFLDGNRWQDPGKIREIEPGQHVIRVEAKGYFSYSQSYKIKSAVDHALSLKLRPKEPHWRKAMRTAHPDAVAKTWTVALSLEAVSARNGNVDEPTDGARDLDTLDESAGLLGFGISMSWRGQDLEILALGLSYQTGGETAQASLEQSTKSELESLDRFLLRLGWVGLRYPVWRVDAYGLAGLGLAIEDFAGKTLSQQYSASSIRPILGAELGLRYSFTPQWFAGTGLLFDFWPGNRSNVAWLIKGGFAFDIKGLF